MLDNYLEFFNKFILFLCGEVKDLKKVNLILKKKIKLVNGFV